MRPSRIHYRLRELCALSTLAILRAHSTTHSIYTPQRKRGTSRPSHVYQEDDRVGSDYSPCASTVDPICDRVRVLRLHNMPRSWMYEEIVEFLHQVAEHASIEFPRSKPGEVRSGSGMNGDTNEDSAVPHTVSPFIARIHIPFGRRTGIVYGTPTIHVKSNDLANYLLGGLEFDLDDYRRRIYFTEAECNTSMRGLRMDDETAADVEQEQALSTLELDRYLLAPDLLYDISRMRQWRLITQKSKVLLRTFTDEEASTTPFLDDHDFKRSRENAGTNSPTEPEQSGLAGLKPRRNDSRGIGENRRASRCAGEYKDLGRGSVHSIHLPTPYVQGRRGT
ncbi:hypothetical protein ERJ75_001008500 [Trypanosoma vivax]|uniref:Uncharacterized protein n=1 Tax=Trypanosoma vivax (strain Y486) TaxID=1055687 RepID=G0TYP2_TRYVY|nr:hypothetical protein TRVL_07702 [Trypanosoma vivax]KAH8611383.1 hypothetical protein ERJ75_001008500 [Trypanosoma vivax]CCC49091.1 conserved hypothetical protein [Trypanosoma vivax Y486]